MAKTIIGNVNTLAKEVVDEYLKRMKEKQRRDRQYNIGLLLRQYHALTDFSATSNFRLEDIQSELGLEGVEFDSRDDIRIQSIQKSRVRTALILREIDRGIERLRAEYVARGEVDKYNVFQNLYLDASKQHLAFSARVLLVAEQNSCSESTVKRWNSELLNNLAVKIFGCDGLRLGG